MYVRPKPTKSSYTAPWSGRARVNAGTERNRLTTGLVLYLSCCDLKRCVGYVEIQNLFITLVASFSRHGKPLAFIHTHRTVLRYSVATQPDTERGNVNRVREAAIRP